MVLLDVEKAYDTVWQDAIVHKMERVAFPINLIKIVQSFLNGRSFQFSVSGHFSNSKLIPYGLPQGAVQSPTLYNIFTSDIVMIEEVEYYLFADDTGFIATCDNPEDVISKLQNAQNSLEDYQRK